MKVLKQILFFSICIVLYTFSGCKKYPDGPLISLLSKEGRLTGEWDVESFSIDGYDSTSYLKSLPLYGIYVFGKHEEGEGNFFSFRSKDYPNVTTPIYTHVGYWKFTNKKESVFIHMENYTPQSAGAFRANDITWDIKRLKNKELWLETVYNGKEYFVKFKPA